MVDETPKRQFIIENEVDHDELKRMFRREVDEKHAFMMDLRNLPEIPSYKTMYILSAAGAKHDAWMSVVRKIRLDNPGSIPYKAEYENGMAVYAAIREALLSVREATPTDSEEIENKELDLEVGKFYVNNKGSVVKIVGEIEKPSYPTGYFPFGDESGRAYRSSGLAAPVLAELGNVDLVAEVTEPSKLIESLDKNQLLPVYDGISRLMLPRHGTLTSHELRIIADELDRRK